MREKVSIRKQEKSRRINQQLRSSYCYETAVESDPVKFPPVYNLSTMSYDRLLILNIKEDEEHPMTRASWPLDAKKSCAPGAKEWNLWIILGMDMTGSSQMWTKIPPTTNKTWNATGNYLYYDAFFTAYDREEENDPAIVFMCYVDPPIPDRPQHFSVMVPAKMLCFDLAGYTLNQELL